MHAQHQNFQVDFFSSLGESTSGVWRCMLAWLARLGEDAATAAQLEVRERVYQQALFVDCGGLWRTRALLAGTRPQLEVGRGTGCVEQQRPAAEVVAPLRWPYHP